MMVLRHLTDSKAWQRLVELFLHFRAESQNVRLGLASPGFILLVIRFITHY